MPHSPNTASSDPPSTLDEALLHADYRSRALAITAEYAASELIDVLGTPASVQEATSDQLAEVYDPSLPTVAIDLWNSFGGSSLLGIANSRQLQSDRTFNIMYVDNVAAGLRLIDGQLTAGAGIFINKSGTVLTKQFYSPVPIAIYETVELSLLTTLENLGVPTLSKSTDHHYFNDKSKVSEIGAASSLVTPAVLAVESLASEVDAVIKPSKGSQGRGVYFTASLAEDSVHYHRFLSERGYEPVIEERVDCWPAHDPKTSEPLDWNVRALISDGELVDMYVRAGAHASAVNKSTGARTVPMNKFYRFLHSSEASAKILSSTLKHAAEDFAHEYDDTFITGIDLTVNSLGQVVFFEANAGNVGGIQTIAHNTTGSVDRKLSNAKKILANIRNRVSQIDKSVNSLPAGIAIIPVSFDSKVSFAIKSNATALLGQYVLSHGVPASTSTYGSLHALAKAANFQKYAPLFEQLDSTIDPVASVLGQFPLELTSSFLSANFDSHVLAKNRFMSGICENRLAYKDGLSWKAAQGIIQANRFDLTPAFATIAELQAAERYASARKVLEAIFKSTLVNVTFPKDYDKSISDSMLRSLSDVVANYPLSDPAKVLTYIEEGMALIITKEAEAHKDNDAVSFWYALSSSLLTRFGLFTAAKQISDRVDLDSDDAVDVLLENYTDLGKHLMHKRDGRNYFLSLQTRLGLSLTYAIDSIRSKKENFDLSGIEDDIASICLRNETEKDIKYAKSALSSVFHGVPIERPSDWNSAQQLLMFYFALSTQKSASNHDLQVLENNIKKLSPLLGDEIDAIKELAYSESQD